jgi:hypothetical protein
MFVMFAQAHGVLQLPRAFVQNQCYFVTLANMYKFGFGSGHLEQRTVQLTSDHSGLGIGDWGLGFGVWGLGLGFGVWGLWFGM